MISKSNHLRHRAPLLSAVILLAFNSLFVQLAMANDPYIGPALTYRVYHNIQDIETAFPACTGSPNSPCNLELEDPNASEDPITYDLDHRTGIVSFVYGKDLLSDVAGKYWWYKIYYSLVRYDAAGTEEVLETSAMLELKHDPDEGIYEDVKRYDLGTFIGLRLRIIGIETSVSTSGPPAPDADLPNDLRLELGMEVEKYYQFDTNTPPILSKEEQPNQELNKVALAWSYVLGAQEYELQYLYWDDYDQNAPPATDEELFRTATRITTWANWHELDLTYPSGKVYFRVRPIGRYTNDEGVNGDHSFKELGAWSEKEEVVINDNANIQNFEELKSWQFTASFAEDGKNKKVITYFDGSLRPRQVVTKLNDAHVALVAETDYSVEGQGTLSILPAPTNENNLFFKPNFNKNSANVAYSYRDFDKSTGADPLNTSAGAGKYFSGNNDVLGHLSDYIPMAAGFALTQVEYMRDGTGRMARQGGVGPLYQLSGPNGSNSAAYTHDTRYFYVNATETELRRLFGGNIGEAEHYKKQVVLDANRQASASYLDQTGKVVATSLMGNNPDNVQALDNIDPGEMVTLSLITDTPVDGMLKTSVNYIMNLEEAVGSQPTHTFVYNVDRLTNEIILHRGAYCKHCEYELEVTVKDPDGLPVALTRTTGANPPPYNNDIYKVVEFFPNNTSLGNPDCPMPSQDPTPNTDVTFTAIFNKIGSYEVTKILRMKQKSAEELFTELNVNGMLPDLQTEFIDPALEALDCSGCDFECSQYCYHQVMGFDVVPGTVPSQPQLDMIKECMATDCFEGISDAADAAAVNKCEGYLEAMKQQVTPGGTDISPADLAIDWDYFWNVIITPSNPLYFEDKDGIWYTWYDGSNVFEAYGGGANQTEIEILDGEEESIMNVPPGSPKLQPNKIDIQNRALTSEAFWQEQWVYELVKAHREYCFYEDCSRSCTLPNGTIVKPNIEGEAFIVKLAALESVAAVSTFLNLGAQNPTLAQIEAALVNQNGGGADPLFANPNCYNCGEAGEGWWMYYTLQHFEDTNNDYILESAISIAQNLTINSIVNGQAGDPNTGGATSTEYWANREWNYYKMMYITARQRVLDQCRTECPYVLDEWAIVQKPLSNEPCPPGTPPGDCDSYFDFGGTADDDANVWSNNQIEEFNNNNLEAQAENWSDEINNTLSDCNISLSSADQLSIQSLLEEYFTSFFEVPVSIPAIPTPPIGEGILNWDATDPANSTVTNMPLPPPNLNLYEVPSANNWEGWFTNKFSTVEGAPPGLCFSDLGAHGTVGFSLEENLLNGATQFRITVIGGAHQAGMLEMPQLYVLHEGGEPIYCAKSDIGQNYATITIDYINQGDPYRFYVSGPDGILGCYPEDENKGVFKLKIEVGPFPTNSDGIEITTLAQINQIITSYNSDPQCQTNVLSSLANLGIGGLATYETSDCFWDFLDIMNSQVLPVINSNCNSIPTVTSQSTCFSSITYSNSDPNNNKNPDEIQVNNFSCLDNTSGKLYLVNAYGNKLRWCDAYRMTDPSFSPFNGIHLTDLHYLGISVNIYSNQSDTEPERVYLFGGTNTTPSLSIPCFIQCAKGFTVSQSQMFVDCKEALEAAAIAEATEAWQAAISIEMAAYYQSAKTCINNAVEHFNVRYLNKEYQYTLYYYNQSGDLVQTIPPDGVHLLPISDPYFRKDPITNEQTGEWIGGNAEPPHTQKTQYRYNTLGQVTWQQSPDGGMTQFHYDIASRLRLSQNAKQRPLEYYSYTRYDRQGRITEVGQINHGMTTNDPEIIYGIVNNPAFPDPVGYSLEQQTFTEYDNPDPTLVGVFEQENLRGRVAKSSNELLSTYYSYDPHGNVKSLLHRYSHQIVIDNDLNHGGVTEIEGIGDKRIDYTYDLISGNVNSVSYQEGQPDQFYHRYEYDADNRLKRAYTSEDSYIWENDARYFYYTHGPLARVELGHDKVQGMDYYYTMQGWIKGVNSINVGGQQLLDPGKDGHNDPGAIIFNPNSYVARDEMSYFLGYHQGDYTPVSNVSMGNALANAWSDMAGKILDNPNWSEGLFNGNIALMATRIGAFAQNPTGVQSFAYQYDQLHRIKQANSFYFDGLNWKDENNDPNYIPYTTYYAYDPNGNIKNLARNTNTGKLDKLTYDYNTTGKPNQLTSVTDQIPTTAYPADFEGTSSYQYDAIGNIIAVPEEQVDNILWTVYGKVQGVYYPSTVVTQERNISYRYDPSGNRGLKVKGNSGREIVTWYVRDATGNVMSVYEKNVNASLPLVQKEVPLYGSARLGMRKFFEGERDMENPPHLSDYYRLRGRRAYELSNHLGNVLTTVSDQKDGIAVTDPWVAEHYEAKYLTATDYFPFGMEMPGRVTTQPGAYRYGFNGKEKDEDGEIGLLTNYDYGFRIYNPAIARFLSVDPLTQEYPFYTPYQFAGNMPSVFIDLDGLEPADGTVEARDNVQRPILLPIDVPTVYREAVLKVMFNANNKTYVPVPGPEKIAYDFFTHKIIPERMSEAPEAAQDRYRLYGVVIESLFSTDPEENKKAVKTINLPKEKWYNNQIAPLVVVALPANAARSMLKMAVIRTTLFEGAEQAVSLARTLWNVGKGRNIAIATGAIGGEDILSIGISGAKSTKAGTAEIPTTRIFAAIEGSEFDSEVKVLEEVAKKFLNNQEVKGSITLLTERPACTSCQGVIKQFMEMFPNIELKVHNGVPPYVAPK
ncbi:MAG: hypothetical protein GC192_20960 [Bacteroidetes bacterium]|nr:hypothetical protein [Bacteroidota bacterium]